MLLVIYDMISLLFTQYCLVCDSHMTNFLLALCPQLLYCQVVAMGIVCLCTIQP